MCMYVHVCVFGCMWRRWWRRWWGYTCASWMQYGTSQPDRMRPKIRNEQLWGYCERKRKREAENQGAILVQALSWKLQPHYKWRHPEHMDRQTNGVRRAQREATPWLCDIVPFQWNPPPSTLAPTLWATYQWCLLHHPEYQWEGTFQGVGEGWWEAQTLEVRG